MKRSTNGFTLIELMLVIAILGIIAAIALPSFLGQIQKARRSDAKQALFQVAAKLEQFYQDNKGYPDGTAVSDKNIADLGYSDPDSDGDFDSLEGYYAVSTTGTAIRYRIQAIPISPQTDDTACYTFALNHLGKKTNWESDGTTEITNDRCW